MDNEAKTKKETATGVNIATPIGPDAELVHAKGSPRRKGVSSKPSVSKSSASDVLKPVFDELTVKYKKILTSNIRHS